MRTRMLAIIVLAISLVGAPPTAGPAAAVIATGCGSPTLSAATVVLGEEVGITVRVSPAPDRGSVWFAYVGSGGNANPLGSSQIDPGTGSASLTTTAIPLGGWSIIGQYSDPTGFYRFCQTTGAGIRVVKYLTSTDIEADRAEAMVGDVVTWTARVNPNPGPGVVVFRFRHGSSTSTREASLDTATGSATVRRDDLGAGVTDVWATFQKLPDYAPSTSSTVSVTVRQPNPGPLGISVPASALQLHPITIKYDVPAGRPQAGLTFRIRLGDGSPTRFGCSLDVGASTCRGAAPREPGTYAIWAVIPATDLFVALMSPEAPLVVQKDGSVEVGTLRATRTTFYPIKDGYRDTVKLKMAARERVTSSARVVNSAGRTIRRFPVVTGGGTHKWVWNGRTGSGRLVPAGTYRFVVKLTDQVGNRTKLGKRLTVSHQRLVWKTMKKTVRAAYYTQSDRRVDGWVRTSASRYSRGVVVHGGYTLQSNARAFYRVKLPWNALRVRKISFCAQGKALRGYRAPFVGLTNFSTQSINWVQIPSDPSTCWGIVQKGSDAYLRRYIRRGSIEGSIVSSGYYGMAYDAQGVGVTVRYATLSAPTPSAVTEETEEDQTTWDDAPDLVVKSASRDGQTNRTPKKVRPAQRRVIPDFASWEADGPELD